MNLTNLVLRDSVSHHPLIRASAALCRFAVQRLQARPLARLEAYQALDPPPAWRWILGRGFASLPPHNLLQPALGRYEDVRKTSPGLTRSLILKAPGPHGERGVIYIAFEYNLYRLLAGLEVPAHFQSRYDIVVGTSWSPTSYPLLALALQTLPGTLYVEASNPSEIPKLESFHSRVHCVSTMPCGWLNPDLFFPKPHGERFYDLLMVANWAPFKRHFELFTSLAKLPPGLKVALIGQKEAGWTQDAIRSLANALGARQKIDIFESIPVSQVRELQCNSKAALLMSRREGSCVAAVEALFANTPLGIRRDAHVGSLAYVNEQTGRRLNPARGMHHEIAALLESAPALSPRDWALQHVSCHQSHRQLNSQLRAHTMAEGRPWTRDLAPMCWNPYPAHLHPEDHAALRPAFEELHRQQPDLFPMALMENSHR